MSKSLVVLAALASASLLVAALGFQYIVGLDPCKLCIWQRWPHLIAVCLLAGALRLRSRALAGAALLSVLSGAGVAGYHAGVELKLWEGPSTCTGDMLDTSNIADLLNPNIGEVVARCDEIPWSFLGLSMAAWNGLLSLGIAGLLLFSIFARRA